MPLVSFLTLRGAQRLTLLAALLLLLLVLARPAPAQHQAPPPVRARFFGLLRAGDSVYARKDGHSTFARSLTYYNRAQTLADHTGDSLLLAEAVFARARVYDAWNHDPARTISAFRRAADLFRRLPGQYRRYLYAQHLVAHAYDKVPDTARAVAVLRGLYQALHTAPDSLLRQVPFSVEMALTATEVGHYPLADSLLRALARRPWIRNDPASYDHLWHYYLVRARFEVLHARTRRAPYLDSLAGAFRAARTPYDRIFYARQLATLYAAHDAVAGRPHVPYDYLRLATHLQDSLAAGGDADHLRQALVDADERTTAHRAQYEAAVSTARWLTIGILAGALLVISVLSVRLYRQRQTSRGQAGRLAVANHALDEQVAQVELLNKEMQHRIKNNLHMIFSLLQMQERRSDNDEVIENLQAARLRVESIAALHNRLLISPDGLDFGAYLRELISAVVSCLANDRQVVTHLQTGALHLSANTYFALSLILNEWVTNSIKYATPAGEVLEINVSVRTHPHEVRIAYADNGQERPVIAGPGRATMPASSGLGTQIIRLLTRQLGATLRTVADHPYHYELCIPVHSINDEQ